MRPFPILCFTGISRNHLDRLVAEPAEPFAAAREGRLHRRRGGRDRRRWPGAGHPQRLTLRDRVLVTLAWLRLALPHQALGVRYRVERSTISAAVRQVRPLLAGRGFATPQGYGCTLWPTCWPTPPRKGSPCAWTAPRSRSAAPKPTGPACGRSSPASANRTRSKQPSPPTATADRCGPAPSEPADTTTRPPYAPRASTTSVTPIPT